MKTNDTHESVSRIAGRGLVLVGLLAVALALPASSFAQSNAAPTPKVADAKAAQPAANSLTAKAARTPRGTGEGIQVHGWWTIEIRNRDGSVARHVEFENALVGDGPAILAGLLSGGIVAGSWELIIKGEASPCSTGNNCTIVQSGSGAAVVVGGCATALTVASPQPFCYATLVPSVTGAIDGDFGFSSFTLSGQAYADTSTSVSSVQSWISGCGVNAAGPASTNTWSPSACYPAQALLVFQFSEYDFGGAGSCGPGGSALCEIPVQAGQVIAASVTFSFSSPSGDGQPATAAVARPRAIVRAPNLAKPSLSTPVNH